MSTKTHRYIYLDELTVDPRVQRTEGLSQKHILEIAEKFNPHALGTIQVSLRTSGRMVVLDGWHRTEAAKIADYKNPVSADVFEGLTLEQEADLFDLFNKTRKLSSISAFTARTYAQDPDYVEMTRIMKGWGWLVTGNAQKGACRAAGAIKSVYFNGANMLDEGRYSDLLSRTIGVITEAWHHDPSSGGDVMIRGLAKFLVRYGDEVDNARLVWILERVTARALLAQADQRHELQKGTKDIALADQIVALYNKGLKGTSKAALKPKPWTR